MTAIVEIYNRNIVFHPRTPFIHRPRTCNRAQIRTVLPPAVSKQCIVNDYSQSVQVQIELGHKATLRKKINQDGHTHDWTCFVRGPPGCNIQHFVDRVVFYLHDSFLKPKRVVKEPPYQVSESGYGSFSLPIEIYFKTKEEPRKIKFDYDLFLHLEDSPPVNHMRCEKLTFNNPQEDFRRKLLKAGGVGVLSSEEGARMPAPGTPQEPPKAVPDLFGASILENDSKKERSKKHHHKSHKEKHEKHKDQKSKVKDTNSSSSTPQHPATPNPPSTTPTPTHKSSDSHSHSHDKSTKDRHSSKRSSEEGIPSEIPAKKKKKDKDRDKERERSKSTSSSKDKQDKHKHEKDKSVKPEIGSTENVNTSSSVSVKESEKDKKDKEKHREKHRDGSSSSHNKHKHKSHKDKRHEHKSDKKSGEHKSDKKSDEHKKVENKSDSHRSGSPSKHKSRESTKSPPKSQPEKHDMSLSSKKIDKSSTETSKTKESSPKAKESSPKAKESSLKAKECSPNAKESSPKAKEHTPKAKEPTPKSKEHSPKSKESHKKESSAAVNKDSPQKVADSSKSKEMKKLPPLEDLFDASESDPFEDDDSDKEDAPDSKTDAGLTSSQQKMVDDRSKQFLKSLFDDDDDDSEDDDEGGEKPEETVTAGDDTKVVDMDIDDDDDGDDEDDDEGPPTKPSSPNNIFSKFDHPVSHPVVSPTHQMSPQHLVEAVSNGLSSVDTLVDNTDKSYSYLNESKKHRSRLSPSAAVPSGGSTHRSRPYHPTLQADHPMQRLDQLEPRIADHPVEHVDQPTQRADYPSQQLPHSPSKSRTTPQAHRHGKDPEPAHWSSSKTNSRPRDLEQQPWATNQTSTPVPKSHDPTTWATSHSEILAKNKKLSPPKLGMEPPDLLKSHGDFLQHQVPQHSPDSGKGHQVREHKSPTPASRMLLENGSSLPEPTQHPGCAPNGEPFTLLLSIQEKLSSTREEAVLGEVIRILDSNDEVFSITNTSLDFDLCYVNSVTIQQLKHCLQLS